jgi:hypothetical protein
MKNIFIVLTMILASDIFASELLTNPGFENSLTGWSQTGESSWSSISTTSHSSTKSVSVTCWNDTSPYSASRYFTQTVTHQDANEYILSVWARDNWSSGSGAMSNAVTLKLQYYNSSSALLKTDQRSFALAKDYKWHQFFITSTNIPANAVSVKATIGTGLNKVSILFDDASLVKIKYEEQLPHTGDLNNDLTVNLLDWALFADSWMQNDSDITSDGRVNWNELPLLADNWLIYYSGNVTAEPDTQTLEKYSRVFFDINLDSPFTNPYNPDDVRVDLEFIDPCGNSITLPCFYVSGDSNNSNWQGRFTPRKTGRYYYNTKIYVNDILESASDVNYITVLNSTRNGLIHKNPNSNYCFLYDSGKPFRGIGENLCWDPRPLYDDPNYTYEYMFPRLSASACNFARVWIYPWNAGMPLEWISPGLGRYDEAAAKRIDAIFSLAEQNGIYLMLTLDGCGALYSIDDDYWTGNNFWKYNPYNTANGGPCAKAADFFTNADAKNYYKKRLRYIIARWGYQANLAVIEFFNEIDGAYQDGDVNIPAADIVSWHSEMATYIKSIDPFEHLISTSAGYKTITGLWNVSNLDFSQSHPYGSTNDIYSRIVSFTNNYGKPYVVGEFGYDWHGPGSGYGTQSDYERELRMGMWRGMFSPTPIVPLTWWWDSLAEWNDWYILNAAASFCRQMFSGNNDVLSQGSATTGSNIEIMSLKNGSKNFVWMRNNSSSTISNAILSVPGLTNGNYRVSYYDTLTATFTSPVVVNVTNGTLQIAVPSLAADKDIACTIEPAE